MLGQSLFLFLISLWIIIMLYIEIYCDYFYIQQSLITNITYIYFKFQINLKIENRQYIAKLRLLSYSKFKCTLLNIRPLPNCFEKLLLN